MTKTFTLAVNLTLSSFPFETFMFDHRALMIGICTKGTKFTKRIEVIKFPQVPLLGFLAVSMSIFVYNACSNVFLVWFYIFHSNYSLTTLTECSIIAWARAAQSRHLVSRTRVDLRCRPLAVSTHGGTEQAMRYASIFKHDAFGFFSVERTNNVNQNYGIMCCYFMFMQKQFNIKLVNLYDIKYN